jgi:hypothetical protein
MFDDAFAFQLPETESISKFYYGKLHHSVMFNSKKSSPTDNKSQSLVKESVADDCKLIKNHAHYRALYGR